MYQYVFLMHINTQHIYNPPCGCFTKNWECLCGPSTRSWFPWKKHNYGHTITLGLFPIDNGYNSCADAYRCVLPTRLNQREIKLHRFVCNMWWGIRNNHQSKYTQKQVHLFYSDFWEQGLEKFLGRFQVSYQAMLISYNRQYFDHFVPFRIA